MTPHYSTFSHENESASPGFYQVKLDNGINVKLTCSKRAGFHQYSFPEGADAKIIVDLGFWQNTDKPHNTFVKIKDENTIVGHRHSYG